MDWYKFQPLVRSLENNKKIRTLKSQVKCNQYIFMLGAVKVIMYEYKLMLSLQQPLLMIGAAANRTITIITEHIVLLQ